MPEGGDLTSFEEVFERYRIQSENQLSIMRETASELFGDGNNFIIGVNGSLARREFTSGSDVDLFFLARSENLNTVQTAQQSYREELQKKGIKMPAKGGVFEQPLPARDMLEKIGGDDDTNIHTTRRMLFLLEGDWVFNEAEFDKIREDLINRYVEDGLDDRKICLFLLNDIIRYWRTICVDYEFKIADDLKAKAIRLIKLRFSRMLLYFAGVIAIGETKDKNYEQKRATLGKLLSMPAVDRVRHVLPDESHTALNTYAEFLTALDDPLVREQLELNGEKGINTEAFQELSEKARNFKDQLFQLLLNDLGTNHPLIKSIIL